MSKSLQDSVSRGAADVKGSSAPIVPPVSGATVPSQLFPPGSHPPAGVTVAGKPAGPVPEKK